MRPAKLGRDSAYATSDPGHEYEPGVTETWLGLLARRWGVHGQRATPEARENLYKGLSPDGKAVVFPPFQKSNARPVIGGNFFAPKELNAWLVLQPDAVRRRAEKLFLLCVALIVETVVLPSLQARRGKGGKTLEPAETLACLFKHVTNSPGYYTLHALLEVFNAGHCRDGKLRGLHGKTIFDLQRIFQRAFEAVLITEFQREFGLVLRPGRTGSLHLKGFERLAEVETPRREQMRAEREAKGLPDTPKTRHYSGQKTHTARDRTRTAADAVRRSWEWLKARGLTALKAVRHVPQRVNELVATRRVESAVRGALNHVDRAGVMVDALAIHTLARFEAAVGEADLERVKRLVDRVLERPHHHGLVPVGPDAFVSKRTLKSEDRAHKDLERLGRKKAELPDSHSLVRTALDPNSTRAEMMSAVREKFRRKVTLLDAPSPHLVLFLQEHRDAGARVFISTPKRLDKKRPGVQPETPESLAARLTPPTAWRTFLRVRSVRWRSPEHAAAVFAAARKPELVLKKSDVIVLDTRGACAHAVARIARAARKARATVVVIGPAPQEQDLSRDDRGRDR